MSFGELRLDEKNVSFLGRARWFQQKGSRIIALGIRDEVVLQSGVKLCFVDVKTSGRDSELYLMLADELGELRDIDHEAFIEFFTANLDICSSVMTCGGRIMFTKYQDWNLGKGCCFEPMPLSSSNTLMRINPKSGPGLMAKFIRRLQAGDNVEVGVNRHIFGEGKFSAAPMFKGSVEYVDSTSRKYHIASLFEYVENQGSAWDVSLKNLSSLIGEALGSKFQGAPVEFGIARGADFARSIGGVLASLHLSLSREGEGGFGVREVLDEDLNIWHDNWIMQFDRAFSLLENSSVRSPNIAKAISVKADVRRLLDSGISDLKSIGRKIRQHGDFHLGQLLVCDGDLRIIDFEGEPLKDYAERAIYYPALKDVAGIVRSFNYAAFAAYFDAAKGEPEEYDLSALFNLCFEWERVSCKSFLDGYFDSLHSGGATFLPPENRALTERALNLFVLDKALYEIEYEINNRPDWVEIPISGIMRIMEAR